MLICSHIRLGAGRETVEVPSIARTSNHDLKKSVPTRLGRLASRATVDLCGIVLFVVASSLWCFSADIVLLRSGAASSEQHELELASQFYGLNLRVVTASSNDAADGLDAVKQNRTIAVAVEANALSLFDQKSLLRALYRKQGNIPLLILGISSETNTTLLDSWSGGAVIGTDHLASPVQLQYAVGHVQGITEQLSDREIPFPGDETFFFTFAGGGKVEEIMAVRNSHQAVPVFVAADLRGQKVFLLCKKHSRLEDGKRTPDSMVSAFAEIAPVMMFTKYCAGERGWHAIHHYANLTIDDPWLREPYGHLSYKGLLTEMEKHDFHTTIAFIPWNYDRSEAGVVSLFQNHPDRFSICVHGDNHDHKEFEDLKSKPLGVQVAALKQSLARMGKFQGLTRIPYNNVFVFPHSIGTENILEGLKNYNFLATINSSNIPMDRLRPPSFLFNLRPVTLSFANFPSIIRYPATMPSPGTFLGVNEFLDNPLFLYSHHDFFAGGIDSFDKMADEVNHLEPDTRWRSVGEIVNHLYLVRLRDDSNYDVLTFSGSIGLENTSGRDLIFYVRKRETGSPVISSVSVDGQPVPFHLRGGDLNLSVPIPAGKSRSLLLQYKNDLDLASISTAKSSFRVSVLRKISDYRDITLSKYRLGQLITDYYYKHDETPLRIVLIGCTLVLCGICGGWGLWAILKRKNPVAITRTAVLPNGKITREAGDGFTRF
jgi:hypothetical protein